MKTFVDAGALIAAYRGENVVRKRALDLLDSTGREFVTSDFVRLEILPKAFYHKRADEVSFYEAFFENAEKVNLSNDLVEAAVSEAKTYGLSAMDALHVALAKAAGCVELSPRRGRRSRSFG